MPASYTGRASLCHLFCLKIRVISTSISITWIHMTCLIVSRHRTIGQDGCHFVCARRVSKIWCRKYAVTKFPYRPIFPISVHIRPFAAWMLLQCEHRPLESRIRFINLHNPVLYASYPAECHGFCAWLVPEHFLMVVPRLFQGQEVYMPGFVWLTVFGDAWGIRHEMTSVWHKASQRCGNVFRLHKICQALTTYYNILQPLYHNRCNYNLFVFSFFLTWFVRAFESPCCQELPQNSKRFVLHANFGNEVRTPGGAPVAAQSRPQSW